MISPNPNQTLQGQGLLLTLFLQVRKQTSALFDGKVSVLGWGAPALNTHSPGVNPPTPPPKKTKTLLGNLFRLVLSAVYQSSAVSWEY